MPQKASFESRTLEELYELNKELKPKWTYVKGHNGDKWNERADEIATSFADGNPVKLKK